LRSFDRPTPRIRKIECTADFAGAAMRHVEESPRIAAVAALTLGDVEHNTARSALDLISGLAAKSSKLRDHRL
jgi:hypothetical protein